MIARNPSTKTVRLLLKWLPQILAGALAIVLKKLVAYALVAGFLPWLNL